MLTSKSQLIREFELIITKEEVISTDNKFNPMTDNLGIGDNYKPLEVYFEKANGQKTFRKRRKREREITNQTMPRLAFQIFEKQLLSLSQDERKQFPICQYRTNEQVICGIYTSVDEFKNNRNTLEYVKYVCNDNSELVIYCWNVFSTITFVKECLKRFGDEGDKFVLTYCEKDGTKSNEQLSNVENEQLSYINEDYIMNRKLNSVNTILYGPPGTGKTYKSVIYAVNTIDKDIAAKFEGKDVSYEDYLQTYLPKYRELEKNNQIVFTTFHQSYGYEEFIEGIKPKTDEGNVIYNVEAGVFKEFCKRAKDSGNLEGIDNFEESWGDLREDIEEEEFIRKLNQTDKKFKNTKDGVELLNPEEDDKSSYFISREQCYEFYRTGTVSKNKARLHFIKAIVSILKDEYGLKDYIRPSDDSNKKFVFIIDEINRGNISKIFGELITLIEDSKREGAKEAMSVKLPYSGEEFSVPNNVYILGTMNTADRSIALMDTALRRRFEFVEMMPDSSTLQGIEVEEIDIKEMLETMNKRIELLYDREHTLGHAFFMGLKEEPTIEKLASIFQNKIIPLLQEYFYEDYEKIMLVLGIKPEEATEEDFISKKEVEGISKSDVEKYAIEPTYQINNEAFKNIDNYRKIFK